MKVENGASDDGLDAEASAFNHRIEERVANGFTPDLRYLLPNEFFYKSFWRDPFYADLYVGEMSRTFVSKFSAYLQPGSRILDAGCGAGYFALELARNGYRVLGIDIAESAIRSATQTRDAARARGEALELEYLVGDPSDLNGRSVGTFDGVLSSGFLHHIPEPTKQVAAFAKCLSPGGILVMHEPQHSRFTRRDAFWVGVVREILKQTGVWYESESKAQTEEELEKLSHAIYEEFVYERDPDEPAGQSPNDLSADREGILKATALHFDLLEDFPSRSFMYRMLGGLRGDSTINQGVATLMSAIDGYAVGAGFLNANYFYAVARLRKSLEGSDSPC